MKTILRNLFSVFRRFKVATLLNVAGLTVAFSACILIAIQVKHDRSFNTPVSHNESIFRLELGNNGAWQTNFAFSHLTLLLDSSPHIVDGTWCELDEEMNVVEIEEEGEKRMFEERYMVVAPNYPAFFSFHMVEGDVNALHEPGQVLIPLSMARRFYGEQPAVGKPVILEKKYGVREPNSFVGGVYQDFPVNTSLKNVVYLPLTISNEESWSRWSWSAFVRLDHPENRDNIINNYYRSVHPGLLSRLQDEPEDDIQVRMTSLHDLHYVRNVRYDPVEKSSPETISIMITIAVVLLLIAGINYTNFSMALIPVRMKSINTQKVMGAGIITLRKALLAETVAICLFSYLLSLGCVWLFAHSFLSTLVSGEISLLLHPDILCLFGCMAILIALFAGIYPAFYITSFPPALVLKGSFGLTPRGRALRNVLVGFQFVVSFVLIIGACFIFLQNRFMRTTDLGYDKEQLIVSNLSRLAAGQKETLRNYLLSYAGIESAGFSTDLISGTEMLGRHGNEYRDKMIWYDIIQVDPALPEALGIQVIEGRLFRPEDKSGGAFIFNTCARYEYDLDLGGRVGGKEIIGFMPDIKFTSFRLEMKPMAFEVIPEEYTFTPSYLYARIKPGTDLREAMRHLQNSLRKVDAYYPFKTWFNDQVIQQMYERESQTMLLVTLFSAVAIFISIAGVFGLVVCESQYKLREIGVKKVFGSTTATILIDSNKLYFYILSICFIIAVPVGYVVVSHWLQNFAYRIPMYTGVFVFSFFIVSLITLCTVTFQNWTVANMNPVNSLQSE